MPSENAEGHLTWNPSVGLYHKPGSVKRESYGGVIAAIQDNIETQGAKVKSYPENFAGIISAIQDLRFANFDAGSTPGDRPPGDIIDNSDPDNPVVIPGDHKNGQLWFDTRQGRMFVFIEGEGWIQTNGADGLPIISDEMPGEEALVPGQMWWDKDDAIMYIFDGTYVEVDGVNVPVWRPTFTESVSSMQTTLTLPLEATLDNQGNFGIAPEIDMSQMHNQKDYNEWLHDAITALDDGISDYEPIAVGTTAPPNPKPNQLWFDTSDLDLSIWYDDGVNQQWVPTNSTYTFDQDFADINASIARERLERQQAIGEVSAELHNLEIDKNTEVIRLDQAINAANHRIDLVPTYDLNQYVQTTELQEEVSDLEEKIEQVKNIVPDLAGYETISDAADARALLQNSIDDKVSTSQLQIVANNIPDVSSFTTQSDISTAINNITTEYLPKTGGRLTGSFVLSKSDSALPGIDFSENSNYGSNAFRFAAFGSATDEVANFGTNDNYHELAWSFKGNEDFCWVYNDTNKVFSITKEGPACSTLYLGDFGDNDLNGRRLNNKIDVRERLNTYQTAFTQIRQGVASATDFDSLKANILSALANV